MQPRMKNTLSETARVRRESTVPPSLHSGHRFFHRPCYHAAACSQHECPPGPAATISKLRVLLHHCHTNTDVTCCFWGGFELVQQLVSGYRCSDPRVLFSIKQAPDSNIPSNSNLSSIHQQRLLLKRQIARRSATGWHP